MKHSDHKLEIAIGIFAFALFGSLGYFINGVKDKSPQEILSLIYSMPRPASYSAAGFDLSGREIDRQYINPFAKKDDKKTKDAQGMKVVGQPLVPVAQSVKKVKTANVAKKSPEVTVSVVEKDKDLDSVDSLSPSIGANVIQQAVAAVQKFVQDKKDKNEDKEEVLGPNQWRSLFAADPSSKNLNSLVSAYSKGKVDEQTFYTILNDLLLNSKAEVQMLGVLGANATPSEKSFTILATNFEFFAPEVAAQADSVMAGYSTNARQGAILKVLAGTEVNAVVRAIEVVIKGYEEVKSGVPGDRGDRGEITEQALVSFVRFIPSLQSLRSNQDSRVANAANQALGLIQAVAAN